VTMVGREKATGCCFPPSESRPQPDQYARIVKPSPTADFKIAFFDAQSGPISNSPGYR